MKKHKLFPIDLLIALTQRLDGLSPGKRSHLRAIVTCLPLMFLTNLFGFGGDIVRSNNLPDADDLTVVITTTTYNGGYNISCNGGTDGAATAIVSGGTTPYSYAWSNGFIGESQTGLSAGTYSVTITDSEGLTTNASITLVEPTPLTIDAGPNQTVYYGYPPSECATIAWSDEGGGVPPYNISWSDGGGQSHQVCPGINTEVYTVSITDDNNCVATNSVVICVIDVRCGNNLTKVELCHVPPDNPLNQATRCVNVSSVPFHLDHGDMLAACSTDHSCPPAMEALAAAPAHEVLNVGSTNHPHAVNQESLVDTPPLMEITLNAYPNPFKESTTIEFTTRSNGWAALRLFDHLGRQVSVLFEGDVEQGSTHKLLFDKAELPSGIYLCTLQADGVVITRTLILIR